MIGRCARYTMNAILLLSFVTLCYAGYNLLVKVSGGFVPPQATTTIVATICLQLAALSVSLLFFGVLALRDGQVFTLSTGAYFWAALAGVSIGAAEIGYFYLLGGVGGIKPLSGSVAIPVIVSGTVVIAMLVSWAVFDEPLTWNHWLGSLLVMGGLALLFLNAAEGRA